jgi:hypothetical protein
VLPACVFWLAYITVCMHMVLLRMMSLPCYRCAALRPHPPTHLNEHTLMRALSCVFRTCLGVAHGEWIVIVVHSYKKTIMLIPSGISLSVPLSLRSGWLSSFTKGNF